MVRLQVADLVLELAPDVGGAISAFYGMAQGHVQDHWLRPASTSALLNGDPLGMASFPLVPWCNRIRQGRAHAMDREIALPPDQLSANTIHGLGWQRPWRVLASSDTSAQLSLHHEGEGRAGWPWSFTAEQDLVLHPDGFDCTLRLRNDSPAPMPYGLGHHPYFPHLPGTTLQCEVARMWASDAELLPTDLVQPDFLPRLAQGITLAELDLDNNFTGWRQRFVVTWPQRRHRLVLSAESPLDFFVLYCPRGQDHFCAEPVSNCTDWLNLQGYPREAIGGGVLSSGETATARWSVHLEPRA